MFPAVESGWRDVEVATGKTSIMTVAPMESGSNHFSLCLASLDSSRPSPVRQEAPATTAFLIFIVTLL